MDCVDAAECVGGMLDEEDKLELSVGLVPVLSTDIKLGGRRRGEKATGVETGTDCSEINDFMVGPGAALMPAKVGPAPSAAPVVPARWRTCG